MHEEHSGLDSKFEIVKYGDKEFIIKEITPKLNWNLSEMRSWIEEYFRQFEKAEIPFPKVVKSILKPGKIVFTCEYKGMNALDFIRRQNPKDFMKNVKIIKTVVEIIKKAQTVKFFLDPHIKNFVLSDRVYYVDFSPPYMPKYFEARYGKTNKHDAEVLEKFYANLSHEKLGYHFPADLLKINGEYIAVMPQIYELFKSERIISGSYDEFLKKGEEIKTVELQKEWEKITLM
jgi:hypothetical protein